MSKLSELSDMNNAGKPIGKIVLSMFLLAGVWFASPEASGQSPVNSVEATQGGPVYPVRSRPGAVQPSGPGALPVVIENEGEKAFNAKYGVNPMGTVRAYVSEAASTCTMPVLSRATLNVFSDQPTSQLFPDRLFYILRFAQWPVAFPMPEGFSANTILVINSKGEIEKLLSKDDLREFFSSNVESIKEEPEANLTLTAWLALLKELMQDGMFEFEIDKDSYRIDVTQSGVTASGVVKVLPRGGNEGSFSATLQFDKEGCLQSATTQENLQAGIRPI
ncbi:MAG: hypothetical protein K8F91_02530, partial [Candidatus Obscuribacterales bacterium]|nr:hypothetical protein [Candidatus Obscuribacterales bacterium]